MKHRIAWAVLIISITIPFWASSETEQEKAMEPGFHSIRWQDVYDYCRTMVQPRFAGRYTGHEGYTRAAQWAAGMFKKWGLKPINKKEGFLQAYPSPYVIVHKAEMTVLAPAAKKEGESPEKGEEIPLKPEDDFMPLLYSDSGQAEGDLVFAGWGISAPELGYDDYAGIDVRGKFVICFRGTPEDKEKKYVKYDHHRFRMETAKAKGAVGLLYIYDDPIANPNGDRIPDFLPAVISEKSADLILKEKGIKSGDLKKDLETYSRPISFPLNTRIRYSVEAEHHPEGTGYNVVGIIEGSDPQLRKEALVIGGHYDHCGEHMGLAFYGADDNASGSAVVMEAAEAFSKLRRKPKRTVIFVLFGGEEMGLMGSQYFVKHLPPAGEKTEAMINLDMVGEGDKTRCGLTENPPALRAALEEADRTLNLITGYRIFKGVGVRGSDYASFYNEGMACAAFMTNGPHIAYHKTGDTIYRINPDIMADMTRLVFKAAYIFADR